MIHFWHKMAVSSVKNANFYPILRRKHFFQNHNIGSPLFSRVHGDAGQRADAVVGGHGHDHQRHHQESILWIAISAENFFRTNFYLQALTKFLTENNI
jgi:hypothetical protein